MLRADPAGLKIGPYWIRPGLSRGNVATVIFASFTSIALTVYLSLIQPYVLNEIVHIPMERQGSVTGYLTAMQETLVVLLVGFIGAWSDRVGKRLIFTLGFLAMACGYLIYPLASSETELFLYRAVFALGLSAVPVMLSISVQDTPQEISRGKWIAINNICQGLGILLLATFLLGRAPAAFQSLGLEPAMAGRLSLWSACAICLFASWMMWRGLPRHTAAQGPRQSIFRQFGAGIQAGLSNPRLGLAFAAAFIGRGDLVIIGNFLTLWVTQAGIDAGLDTAAASGRAFMLFGIVQIAALSWAAVIGVIADRRNRVTALCIAMALASAGYSLMGQLDDPLSGLAIPVAVLLGMGEISVIVAGGALLGQEARVDLQGAVIGAFNLMGGIGIVMVSGLGGVIYDTMGPTMPFVLMGLLNGLLLMAAIVVRFSAGEPVAIAAVD